MKIGKLDWRSYHLPSLISIVAHLSFLGLWIVFSIVSYVQPRLSVQDALILRPFTLTMPLAASTGGGGGGERSPRPASRGDLPRVDVQQLVPPTAVIKNLAPDLIAEPTIVDLHASSLPRIVNLGQLGDPNGVIGPPSSGTGNNSGIGNEGDGHGVGDKKGPGAGSGDTPGVNGGPKPNVVAIGTGGASPPSCPIPASEPNYTEEARRAHIQGTVSLDVIVNSDGRVTVTKVARGRGYGLDEEASQYVARSFRCRPGTYQGQPVATPIRIEVNFHLY